MRITLIACFTCFFLFVFGKASKEFFIPGEVSNSLSDLDSSFRTKVEKLIDEMNKTGYYVKVSETYRSQERQEFIYSFYKKLSEVTGFDMRVTSTIASRHSRTVNLIPASCAVDLRPAFIFSIEEKAKFYSLLRDKSVKMGLRSGANFERRKSSPYYKYNLGYDPGHVEMRCN